ncbi:MAG TPA: hypothetical protein VHZ53_09805 [Steroidobacteraceae bacterium]|jgi:hypothetical protein|nr:hypothetical protein [Steroidobacteraceae bacterium]
MTTPHSAPRRDAYEPPSQSRLGQWVDAAVLLLLVFGALYTPVLLGWTSPAAKSAPVAHPTWASLHQNAAMAAQWEKLGYDPAKAAPLITSRFDYSVDPKGLIATALVLIGYFCFVVVVSDREYREVIAERFGPRSAEDASAAAGSSGASSE